MSLPTSVRVSSNSYLRVPHSEDFNFGSGDFSIEFWVKFNSWLNDRGIVTKGWPSHTGAFLIYAASGSRIAFYASSNGSSWDIANNQTVAPSIALNTWYHVAVTRSGSTFRTFVNGSLTSSWNNGSALVNDSSRSLAIGNGDTGSYPIDGWIDGLRISKGVARYTTNFVPNPLDPVTISSFDDGSRFDKPVGNKGPVVISSAQSQFGGASAYFDGNSYLGVPGDSAWQLGTQDFTIEAWINPDNMNGTKAIVGNYDGADGGWRLAVGSPSTGGTVNYGPEVAFTATNYGNEVDIIIPGVLEITRGDAQGIYNSAIESSYSQSSSPANTVWNRCREYQQGWWGMPGCCVEDANNWTNICNYATRTYGNWRDYGIVRNCYQTTQMVNKELIMKHVPTNRYWAIKFTSWQQQGGGAFSYIRKEILGCTVNSSIVQFRNGNTTIVEKEVSPPLASGTWYHLAASRSSDSLKLFLDGNILGSSEIDPYYNNISLLLHADGDNASTTFIDNSPSPKTITVNGNTQISTTESKFGGASAYFDGSGDYLSINNPSESIIRWFDTNYAIEFWMYPTTYNCNILGNSSDSSIYWTVSINTDGNLNFYYWTGSQNNLTSSSQVVLNQWHHVAVVYSQTNNTIKIYLDGIETASSNKNGSPQVSSSTVFNIGGFGGGFNGYLDEIRITRGSDIARYVGNFTPPSSAFPNQGPFTDNINRINSNGLTIGSSRSSNNVVTDSYKGYIDDLRITKGVSRYASSFVKPQAPAPSLGPAPTAPLFPSGLAVNERNNIFKISLNPPLSDGRSPITAYNFQYSEDGSTWNNTSVVSDPHYDKVSLLLPMTGSNNSFNIFDDSKHNHNISIVGDTKITTSQSAFNNGSAVFDGSVDTLVVSNNEVFDLRGQNWTIEAWIRPTGDWSKYNTIITKRGNGGSEGTDLDWQLYLRQSSGVLCFSSVSTQESGAVPYTNVWNHVAAVRNGQIITLYLNGISILSYVADTLYTTNRKVYVGGWPAGNEYFYGNMNDVRVTKGVARYTSNFDPRLLTQAPANRITELSSAGTPYVFRSRSVNIIGASDYSSSTTPVIETLGAPTNLNIIPDSDRVYLSWTEPTPNNSAIRDYKIEYSSDGGETWTTFNHDPSIETSIIVTGLTAPSYVFRVSAINFAGAGQTSEISSSTIMSLREDNTYNKTRLLLHLDS